MKFTYLSILTCFFLTLGCEQSPGPMIQAGQEIPAGQEMTNCTTDADCSSADLPEISIWYPTCSGDTLQTPTGTGEPICGESNTCMIDFKVEERDCSAEFATCGPNFEEGAQGDTCLPIEIG